ncbi:hypothetical protein L484_018013 [Morus notabilis]|uniref:Uncharacterized protein n=1 Tax=Morus notabilis TaxID=981085 RepID=W9RRN8_9ROSA|nr:hypothetical protein L484_018013 [Morus notabilis]
MKWVTLLKDIKEKVGLTQSPSSSSSTASASYSSLAPSSSARDNNALSAHQGSLSSPESVMHSIELELDFKRFWEEFRSSSLKRF